MAILVIGNNALSSNTTLVPAIISGEVPLEYAVEKKVDGGGVLVNNGVTKPINLSNATEIGDYALPYAYYMCHTLNETPDFSNITRVGYMGCQDMLYECVNLTVTPDLSNISYVDISGLRQLLIYCTSLTEVPDLSGLTEVKENGCDQICYQNRNMGGDLVIGATTVHSGAFRFAFHATGIHSAVINNVVSVNNSQEFSNCFYEAENMETLEMRSLETIASNQSLYGICSSCRSLISFNLESLTTISSSNGLSNGFQNCRSLTIAEFPSLTTVSASYGMSSCFSGCTSLANVYFYALTTLSTSGMRSMLDGVTGCTVHFPIAIQSTIQNYSDVSNGFGGSNISVLFDIVTTMTGNSGDTFTRSQKDSTDHSTAWKCNDVIYYTNGTQEPVVSDYIYYDEYCSNMYTSVSSIA